MTAEERRLEAAAARANAGQRNLARNIAAQRIDELRKKIRGLRATRNLSRGLIKARTRARSTRTRPRELRTIRISRSNCLGPSRGTDGELRQ